MARVQIKLSDGSGGSRTPVWLLSPASGPAIDPAGVRVSSLADLHAAASRLRQLLDRNQVTVQRNSWTGRALRDAADMTPERLAATDFTELTPAERLATVRRHQNCGDLIALVRVIEQGALSLSSEHLARLRHLASGDHATTSVAASSRERNLVFEIACAGWLRRFASDVVFEEPPDVACTWDGEKYGLACKVAYGSAETVARAIRKGAEQLQRSTCHEGVVVVRITDVFPHAQLPGFNANTAVALAPRDADAALDRVNELARPFIGRVVESFGGPRTEFFTRHPKVQCVTFVGNTLVYLHGPGGAVQTTVPINLFWCQAPDLPDFARKLGDAYGR